MNPVSIWVKLSIANIVTFLSSQGTSFVNPPIYLWSVFFKIDGTTAQVVNNPNGASLQGTATVFPTQGDQGDLPGGVVQASFPGPATTVIPSSLGTYATTLVPFPVSGISGLSVGGMIVGWLGILLYHNNTPASAITAGHNALNNAVQQALNNAISTITVNSAMITPAQISSAQSLIQSQVVAAIENALSFGNKLETLLGTEFQDAYVGNAVQYFSDAQLLGSSAQGLPINYGISWGGSADPDLYGFTFNGTAIANAPPFSLIRVLTGLGQAPPPPVSMRALLGAAGTKSLLAWIEAVA
jgi:hypothetical protein